MLGGGDLDGDVYNVKTRPSLMPAVTYPPAAYEPAQRKELHDHESTMDDVADFVADFISSNVSTPDDGSIVLQPDQESHY